VNKRELKDKIKNSHLITICFSILLFCSIYSNTSNNLVNIESNTLEYMKTAELPDRDNLVKSSSFSEDLYKHEGLYYVKDDLIGYEKSYILEESFARLQLDSGVHITTEISFNGNDYNILKIKNEEIQYLYINYNGKKLFYYAHNLNKKNKESKKDGMDSESYDSIGLGEYNMTLFQTNNTTFLQQQLEKQINGSFTYSNLFIFHFICFCLSILFVFFQRIENKYRGEYLSKNSISKKYKIEESEDYMSIDSFFEYIFSFFSKNKKKERNDFSKVLINEDISFLETKKLKKQDIEAKINKKEELNLFQIENN